MIKKVAEAVAADYAHNNKSAVTKVGSHVTNGVENFVVHVTWAKEKDKERRKPFTISDPTQG